MKTDVK